MRNPKPLHWQAYEYEPRERSADWFWAVGIIAVSVAVTAIIFNNVLFAIVVILGGFVLSLYAARPPRIMDIVLDELGIKMDKIFYPYRSLESFWVEEYDGIPKILIKSQRLIMPYIIVHLDEDDVSAEKVRKFLMRFLPEVYHSESFLEKVLDRLGF